MDASQIGFWFRTPEQEDENPDIEAGKLQVVPHWKQEFGEKTFSLRDAPIKTINGLYLLEALEDFGWCSSNGFGPMPLNAETIAAYKNFSKEYEDWELKIIWELSKSFVVGYKSGDKLRSISPYQRFDENNKQWQ